MKPTASPRTVPQRVIEVRARRRAARWALRAALLLAGLPLLASAIYVAICVAASLVLSKPARHFGPEDNPAVFGVRYLGVRFPSRGGDLHIAGWMLPAQGSARAVIMVHGKDESRTEEFDGHFVDLAAALEKRGLNVLMIDLRGHGQSDPAHFSFGPDEARDIEGAADWLKRDGFHRGGIGVLGVSLGAASAIYATAEDRDISALVEDSGYAAIYPIIQANWRSRSHLPNIFLRGTVIAGRLLEHVDVTKVRPVEAMGKIAPRPVLIIHGEADRLVPVRNAMELEAADPSATVWLVPGVDHAEAYNANPQAYTNRVAQFFIANLRP